MITAVRIAWAACALTLTLIALSLVFSALNGQHPFEQSHLLLVAACALAGGLIGAHRPGHPVGGCWPSARSASRSTRPAAGTPSTAR
nr:hypothetical protein GCM10020093_093820 [Planobispora longispora]